MINRLTVSGGLICGFAQVQSPNETPDLTVGEEHEDSVRVDQGLQGAEEQPTALADIHEAAVENRIPRLLRGDPEAHRHGPDIPQNEDEPVRDARGSRGRFRADVRQRVQVQRAGLADLQGRADVAACLHADQAAAQGGG